MIYQGPYILTVKKILDTNFYLFFFPQLIIQVKTNRKMREIWGKQKTIT